MLHRLVLCVLTTLVAFISNEIVSASSSRGPIIGIFAQPAAHSAEYIAASYIKWVEMAGGRVVPIPYTAPKEYLKSLIPQLNGVLFPGGAANVNDQAKYIYQLALELNDQGIHFPVWGTCLGFEWLLDITAEDDKAIQGGFDSMNISLPLSFTDAAAHSRVYGDAPSDLLSWLKEKPLTMNNHMQGMSPERFAQYSKLTDFYTILSLNQDRKGQFFISSIEAKNYPIYAIQFHPEKNSFEYGTYSDGRPYEVVDHSYEAIQIGQYFANFFVNQARKNTQQFKDPTVEQASLIYNYQTSTITAPSFVESYIFKHQTPLNYWRIE